MIGGAKHNASLASASGVPLVGIYPTAGKLRTWTIADCACAGAGIDREGSRIRFRSGFETRQG